MNSEAIKTPVTLEAIEKIIVASELRLETKIVSQIEAKIEAEVGELAAMTKRGFDALELRLDSRIDGLESRLNEVSKNLETQIDDLAIAVNNEFKRIHIRLDEMDKHLITFKENDRKLDKRVTRLEKAVFA